MQDTEIRSVIEPMCTLPGVSFISACDIIAELGSLKQYPARELSALSGLAPYIKESGSSVHSSDMSRKSSGRVRQILYLDSIVGIPKIPALQEFHQRLLEKGKKKRTVRCACMREMLLIHRLIVVHQIPFDKNFQKKTQSRLTFDTPSYTLSSCPVLLAQRTFRSGVLTETPVAKRWMSLLKTEA